MSATQDVLPTMDALLAAMLGANSTSDWDVLVSYSVTKLNAILPSLWKGDTFNEVSFNRDYLDFGRRTAARLSIGAPTLQFVAGENDKALLTMKLQGWLRTDTLNVNEDTGEIISVTEGADNTKVNIEPGRYQLQAAVPLVNMSGDASGPVQEAGQTVVLGEKTSGSKIVFHFKSQNSVYNVTLAPGVTDKRKEDTHMADLGPRIATYFQELNSLDYAVAGVQQPKNEADRDRVLTPESFVFTTQGSSPGVLCVYIKTRGSGNNVGWTAPHFQPNNNNVLPIPQGFTTSIIIRHDLFSEKYLIPQLQTQVAPGGLLHQLDKDNNFANGFRYLLQLNPSALKNNKFGSGPWHNWDLNIDYAFTDPPLALTLSNRSANWYWDFTDYRYPWSHWKSGAHGRVYFDVHLNANYPIASVTDERLALKVDLQKQDFQLWIHPYHGTELEKWGDGWTNTLPDILSEQCYFDINDLRLSSGDFDFFATENVFAPGQHIIKVDSGQGIAAPHDILLVGDIVPPAVLGSHPALVASVDSDDGDGTTPSAASPSLTRLKTLLFTDQAFLTKAFAALRDGKTQDFEKAVSDKQLTVSDSDLQTLQAQASVSPSFDIRLAAGVYKIDSPPSMVAVSMTISPLDGMILFDNVHVENQATDSDTGMVSWMTGQGANVFQAAWSTEFDPSGNVKSTKFNGQTWPSSQPTNKTPFTGSKITPDDSGNWFGSAAAQGASFVLSCVGMTALVLAATILSVQALQRRNADPAPAVDAVGVAAREAANAVLRRVTEMLRRDPLPESTPEVDAMLRERARTTSRITASETPTGAPVGDGESALERISRRVDQDLRLNAARESSTQLFRRFGSTIEILPPTERMNIINEQAETIATRAVPTTLRQSLAQVEMRRAEAFRAVASANADLASAAHAIEEKQGVAERLKSENLAKEAELKEVDEAGTDPAREATLRTNIAELKRQIARVEREQEAAEARREALEDRVKEAQAEAAKAEAEAKDVEAKEPEVKPGPDIEMARR